MSEYIKLGRLDVSLADHGLDLHNDGPTRHVEIEDVEDEGN